MADPSVYSHHGGPGAPREQNCCPAPLSYLMAVASLLPSKASHGPGQRHACGGSSVEVHRADDECAAQTPSDRSWDPTGTAFKARIAIPSHLCPMKGESIGQLSPISVTPEDLTLVCGTQAASVMGI